jgi:hypothetical protein
VGASLTTPIYRFLLSLPAASPISVVISTVRICTAHPGDIVSASVSAEANPVAGIPEYDAIPDIHLRLSSAACGNLSHRITINNSGAISSHMSILSCIQSSWRCALNYRPRVPT